MIFLILDGIVLWFLLNFFSDENWDDQKGKLVFITIAIAFCGLAVSIFLGPYIGLFSLGVYVLLGGVLLKYLAGLEWNKSFQTMSVFLVYKIIVVALLVFASR